MSMIAKVLDFVSQNRIIIAGISREKYSSSFNAALTDAIAQFIVERIDTQVEISRRLGRQTYMLANYYAGAIVGIVKWWVTDSEPCSMQEMLNFSEFRINDLCNYFNLYAV